MPDMTPNDPEWAAAWGWFADPVMEDDATGETLQYMGSEHNGSTYTHVFRHRALQAVGNGTTGRFLQVKHGNHASQKRRATRRANHAPRHHHLPLHHPVPDTVPHSAGRAYRHGRNICRSLRPRASNTSP